jgi:hypothetical protein
LAQVAWQRAQSQLAGFEALSDALENQLAAMDMPTIAVLPEERRLVMSAA